MYEYIKKMMGLNIGQFPNTIDSTNMFQRTKRIWRENWWLIRMNIIQWEILPT